MQHNTSLKGDVRCTQHFLKMSEMPIPISSSLKSWVHSDFRCRAFFSCISLFREIFSCARWAFGEGEGVGVHCCGGLFDVNGKRGTRYAFLHLCWVFISGLIRRAYESSWSVRLVWIKLICMLIWLDLEIFSFLVCLFPLLVGIEFLILSKKKLE